MNAVDRALADPTKCRIYDEYLSVHWYPHLQATTCHCGAKTRDPKAPK